MARASTYKVILGFTIFLLFNYLPDGVAGFDLVHVLMTNGNNSH